MKEFFIEMFLEESSVKYFSKKLYKLFFKFLRVFSKIYQIINFFSKTLFKLKSFSKIIIKRSLKVYLVMIIKSISNIPITKKFVLERRGTLPHTH